MKIKRFVVAAFLLACVTVGGVSAQETQVKVMLEEQFFNSLLNAVFTNFEGPKVKIGQKKSAGCDSSIMLKKEIDGVKTAVRFTDGKIVAPLAFEGTYDAPIIGCLNFAGSAETNIDLSFDQAKNAIIGRAHVTKVNMSGANGLGGEMLAKFVQNAIDQKINPIEIVTLDKLSFAAPIRDSGKLQMRAVGFSNRVLSKEIELIIKYQFDKMG